MCEACWIEEGSPQIRTIEVGHAAWLATQIDPFGPFHVVVEDMNTDDENIEFYLSNTETSAFERVFGECLLALSEAERISALALAEGYWGASRWWGVLA